MSNIKLVEPGSSAFTITLASLASDTNLLAGRQSTAISNLSNLYLDHHIAGKITTGTSPTAGRVIEVWAYAPIDSSLTYPDSTSGGSDANCSMTSRDIVSSSLALVASMIVDSTSDRTYWFKPVSVAALFGGLVPPAIGIWVVHNTAVNLNATGGNHAINLIPTYASVT